MRELESEQVNESELPHSRLWDRDQSMLCGLDSWRFILASPFRLFVVNFFPVAVQKIYTNYQVQWLGILMNSLINSIGQTTIEQPIECVYWSNC